MATLSDKERELVAVGTAIGAGCQPCTHHHVREALKAGLTPEEVQKAIEGAQAVRREGGVAVADVGRRLLGVGAEGRSCDGRPVDRGQTLTYIGAAAGCNAGGLLVEYLATGQALGVSEEDLRGALEVAKVVKKGAAMFLERDVERALKEISDAPRARDAEAWACCEPACDG